MTRCGECFGVLAIVVSVATACGAEPEVVVCRTSHVSPHFTVVECSDGTRTVDDSCPDGSIEITPTECECTGGRGFVYDEVDGFTCAEEAPRLHHRNRPSSAGGSSKQWP